MDNLNNTHIEISNIWLQIFAKFIKGLNNCSWMPRWKCVYLLIRFWRRMEPPKYCAD